MNRDLKIIPRDLVITHFRGSGPGGQNRNKRMTGVRIEHIPTGIVAVATERRSQAQNLRMALERLEEKLKRFLHRPTPRVPTTRTKGSRERRIGEKTGRARIKNFRAPVKAWEKE